MSQTPLWLTGYVSDSEGLEGLAVQTGLWGSVESREGRRYWVLPNSESREEVEQT